MEENSNGVMEIEINKEKPSRMFRKLVEPRIPKPGVNSKHFYIGRFQFSFKIFLSGKQAFAYRCINRSLCKAIIQIPLSQNYQEETFEFLDASNIISLQIITQHSETCPQLNEENKMNQEPLALSQMKSDFDVLEEFVRTNPLLEPKIVKAEMLKKIRFSKNIR